MSSTLAATLIRPVSCFWPGPLLWITFVHYLRSSSALAALTDYQKLGGFSATETYFSQFWGPTSELAVPAWSGSGESHLQVQMAGFSLYPPTVERELVSSLASSYRALIPLMKAVLSWPDYLPEAPTSQHRHTGDEMSTYEFEGTQTFRL